MFFAFSKFVFLRRQKYVSKDKKEKIKTVRLQSKILFVKNKEISTEIFNPHNR
eukprot:UN04936